MAKLVIRDKFLQHIYDEIDFGPEINAAIERRLNGSKLDFTGWVQPGQNGNVNPLPNTPEWMGDVSLRADHAVMVITWEAVDGYDGNIVHNRVSGRTVAFVQWGCKRFATQDGMRARFKHMDDVDRTVISKISGDPRPHAFELIDWCKSVCDHYGWEW